MPNKCTDHLGNSFQSISEMCKYWNLPRHMYTSRKKLKWSLEKILTTPPINQLFVEDHLGNKFPTIADLCTYWNISVTTYSTRIRRNWSIQDALTKPITPQKTPCNDHLGNTFPSLSAMCKHYGITTTQFQGRIKGNWSLEQTLTTPIKQITTSVIYKDPFGKTFTNLEQMCKYHNTSSQYYKYHTKQHRSTLEALNIIPPLDHRIHDWTFDTKLQVIHPIEKTSENKYFLCIFNNHETIMHYDKIIEYCTKQLQAQYQQGGQEWLSQYLTETT